MSHPLLDRQLRRLGLTPDAPPDAARWARVLERVAAAYETADTERYLLERSFTVSSAEMQELYRTLRMREAEQAALRRVAIAVVSDEEPEAVFDLVAEEAARLFGVEGGRVVRFVGRIGVTAGAWRSDEALGDAIRDRRIPLDGLCPAARVFREGTACRVEDYATLDDDTARALSAAGFRSGVAAPILLDGERWGAVSAMSARCDAMPANAEETLGEFARMVTLAIAHSDDRATLRRQASTDPLTGLANHQEFHDRLAGEVARAQRENAPLGLVVIDLDHFKQVNDVHGHQIGDRVLRETAARLRSVTRAGEVVGRVGGEEFAWILPGASAAEAHAAAERAREAISGTPYPVVGPLTASCGVCDLATAAGTQALYRLADAALYAAKSHGRDLTVTHSLGGITPLAPRQRADHADRAHAMHALRALARAIDAKDAYTQQHSERVADMAVRLATALGWPVIEAARLREAALVHDVGKIGVSDAILLKPGRLDPQEYLKVREHAALGARIVQEVLMDDQVSWVAHHHERWDGSGYPDGLAGEEIPEGARLLALADTWDAITVQRGYGSPLTQADALAECRRNAGGQFWPRAVDALEELVDAGALSTETGRDERQPAA